MIYFMPIQTDILQPQYLPITAPSKVPKLKVEDIGGSYAELAWDSVPVDERNGFIRRYTIFYSDKEGKTGKTRQQ